MATRFLLDTNICIYIQKARPKSVEKRFARLKAGDAAISAVTWGELLYGAAKSSRSASVRSKLEEFIGLIPVSPLNAVVAREYGEIRAALESRGQSIGNNDLWIAAHAKAEGWTLVTNNEREFRRVPGLKVQNWVE